MIRSPNSIKLNRGNTMIRRTVNNAFYRLAQGLRHIFDNLSWAYYSVLEILQVGYTKIKPFFAWIISFFWKSHVQKIRSAATTIPVNLENVKALLKDPTFDIKANSSKLLEMWLFSKAHNYDFLTLLIEQGVDLNAGISYCGTLLDYAVHAGNEVLIDFLVLHNQSIKTTDKTIECLLHRRLNSPTYHTIFEKLLQNFEVSLDLQQNYNKSDMRVLLNYVIEKGHVQTLERTLRRADPKKDLLFIQLYRETPVVELALKHNQNEIAKLLIAVHPKGLTHIGYAVDAYNHRDLLKYALEKNNVEIFKLLLEDTVDKPINGKELSKFLYFAIEHKSPQIVSLLVDKGAKLIEDDYKPEQLAAIADFRRDITAVLSQAGEQPSKPYLAKALCGMVTEYLVPECEPKSRAPSL